MRRRQNYFENGQFVVDYSGKALRAAGWNAQWGGYGPLKSAWQSHYFLNSIGASGPLTCNKGFDKTTTGDTRNSNFDKGHWEKYAIRMCDKAIS